MSRKQSLRRIKAGFNDLPRSVYPGLCYLLPAVSIEPQDRQEE